METSGTEPRRERLRAPVVSCPRCGSRPAFRVSEDLVARLEGLAPEARVASYKCQRRACGEIYDVPAAACRNAR